MKLEEPKPLRACHVASGFTGGLYNMVKALANWQVERGLDVFLVHDTTWGLPESFERDFRAGVKRIPWLVYRPINVFKDMKAYSSLRKIILNVNPSLLHLHSSKAGFLGRLAALGKPIQCIYSPLELPR